MKRFSATSAQGAVLLAATLSTGLFNYLFNMGMGRLLGPTDYSVISSLFSFFLIISITIGTVQTVVAKYVADFIATGQSIWLHRLLSGSLKRMVIISAAILLILFSASPFLSRYLQIPSVIPVILVSLILVPSIVLPVTRGALQGGEKFLELGLVGFSEAFLRCVFGFPLVLAGLGVIGGLTGVLAAPVVSLILSIWLLKRSSIVPAVQDSLADSRDNPVRWGEIYRYACPVLLTLLCFTVLTNSDLIFVKHFFSSETAGYYSAAEIVGKIALFIPVGVVPILMFPKTSAQHALQKDSTSLLYKSLLATFIMSGILTVVYFYMDWLIIILLYGQKFLASSHLLGLFGVAMIFYSMVSVLVYYYLSQRQFGFLYWLAAGAVAQIILIQLFHRTPAQVICVMIACGFGLFLAILLSGVKKHISAGEIRI